MDGDIDIPERPEKLYTRKDMINAHRQGWYSAYYHGGKQHQASEEWLNEYDRSKHD